MRVIHFKKNLLVFLLIMLMFLLIFLIIYSTGLKADIESLLSFPLVGYSVAIDPGHGGYDPGVCRDGVDEKDIVLDISRYVKLFLQGKGARVVLTRETDTDLLEFPAGTKKLRDISNRLTIIENSGADILVSIHVNSIQSSVWSGAQTFYSSEEDTDSKRLASLIQEELIAELKNTDRRAKAGSYYLLHNSTVPSVIVETGFITNARELQLLQDPGYQKRVAMAISEGIYRYFKE